MDASERQHLFKATVVAGVALVIFGAPFIGIGPAWIPAGPSGGLFDFGRCELHSENTCSSRVAFARLGALCVAIAWLGITVALLLDMRAVRRGGGRSAWPRRLRVVTIWAAVLQGLLLLLWSGGGSGFGADPWKAAWMLLASAAVMIAIERGLPRVAGRGPQGTDSGSPQAIG